LAVEIGDWDRFTGAYLGLGPSEHSPGQSRAQGPITKTGNIHVRRLLVEVAWHHRTPYRPSVVLQRRWDQSSPEARARAHAGNQRLHAHWVNYNLRKKKGVVATVAVARELAGWCWSLAVLPD
jgi:transposase